MKRAAPVVARVIALTALLFVSFAVAGALLAPRADGPAPEAGGAAALALLAVCVLDAAVIAYLVLRSRWAGWRLAATVFVSFYGVATFMSQLESAVFITRLPPGAVPRLFLMGAAVAAPAAALAVLLFGKRRAGAGDPLPSPRLEMPPSEWAWKLALVAVAYVLLYFTFGYFVAWQEPAVRAYYGGVDEGAFVAHMRVVLRDTPWLLPFQAARALCWAAFALPVVRMLKGGRPETALAVALLFTVPTNVQLLLPNPFMPEAVRMAHLVETASSNFLFGVLVGWLLGGRHARGAAAPAPSPTAPGARGGSGRDAFPAVSAAR
jgi:hypothetical protein